MPSQFEVQRNHFETSRLSDLPVRALESGEVRLQVDFFAFTANNLTYAAAGDMLGYWKFFPASSNASNLWGVIPVWGFADVVEVSDGASDAGVAIGDRLYGYFPPASEVIIKPAKVKAGSLFDSSEHRASLSPPYNRYLRVPQASPDRSEQEVAQALLGPLYNTSYCLFDQLQQNAWYGAEQVLIISASSKTSIGLAYGIAGDAASPNAVGLTSGPNVAFVEQLGIYAQTLGYDDLSGLSQRPSVIVDMAGNSALATQLEAQLGENMRYYISVGLTHWDQNQGGLAASSERGEMFFAPSYMLQRGRELPRGEFAGRAQAYTAKAAGESLNWLQLVTLQGLDDLTRIYPDVCAGKIPPAQGLICKM